MNREIYRGPRWEPFDDDEITMLWEGLDELRETFPTAQALDDELREELARRGLA